MTSSLTRDFKNIFGRVFLLLSNKHINVEIGQYLGRDKSILGIGKYYFR